MEQLAQRFIEHYYPALERNGVTREKKDLKAILCNVSEVFAKGGVPRLKRAIVRNYQRHLDDEIGEREAQDFILSVKELLAELTLTEGA
jgi:hypothetical protein